MKRRALTVVALTFSLFSAGSLQVGFAVDRHQGPSERLDKRRATAGPSVEDLFQAAQDLYRLENPGTAMGPLARAASLSRNDPGLNLWLAHMLALVGQTREAKIKLISAERMLASKRPASPANRLALVASVRNYLGVLAGLDHKKSEAATWFDKALVSLDEPPEAAPAGAGSHSSGDDDESDLRKAINANKDALNKGGQLIFWSPPEDPIPTDSKLEGRSGLAEFYHQQAELRVRQKDTPAIVSAAGTAQDKPAAPGPARRPSSRPSRSTGLVVPPIVVSLVDPDAALPLARGCAQIGDLERAVRLAEASRALRPDSAAAQLVLADLYEAKGWLLEQMDALAAVARLGSDAERAAAQERIRQATERKLELRMEPAHLLVSDHFRVRFSGSPQFAQDAIVCLDRTAADGLRTFGVQLPTVYVRVFPDAASLRAYESLRTRKTMDEMGLMAGGYAITSRYSPGILAVAEGDPSRVLSHEYAHLVWRSLAGDAKLPHWLDEGLAEVVSRGREVSTPALVSALQAGRLPQAEDLERFWASRQVQQEAGDGMTHICYQTARCAMSYFLASYGEDRTVEWLLMIRKGKPAEEAFQELTGYTWGQFFQIWAANCLR